MEDYDYEARSGCKKCHTDRYGGNNKRRNFREVQARGEKTTQYNKKMESLEGMLKNHKNGKMKIGKESEL